MPMTIVETILDPKYRNEFNFKRLDEKMFRAPGTVPPCLTFSNFNRDRFFLSAAFFIYTSLS